MPLRGLVLLTFLVGSIPLCFLRPFYGIALWTMFSVVNPQSTLLYWDFGAKFPWAEGIAIPTILGAVLFCRGSLARLASREVILLVVLWGWFTLTSLASTHDPMFAHHSVETWTRWTLVTKILLMSALTAVVVDSFARLRVLALTVAVSFGFFVLKAIPFLILTGGMFRLHGPGNSMIADNNDFGLALNMTLPIYFYLARTEEKRAVRWFFGMLCLMTVPAILFTYSRGALLGFATVLLFMLLRGRQRLAVLSAAAVAALAIVAFAPEHWVHRMDPTRADALDGSARSRLNSWSFAWRLASEYPVAGGGFSTYTPRLYARYADNPRDNTHGAHSVYFQILAEHGFVGLGLYGALVLSCFLTLRKLAAQGHRERDDTLISYANMLRFGLLGFLVSGMFLGRAYFDYFYLLVACVAALRRIAAEAAAEEAEDGTVDQESETEEAGGAPAVLEAR